MMGEIKQEAFERHSIAVEMINPKIAGWNAEFNRLYPGKDGYSEEYSNFILKKCNEIIDIVNNYDIGHNLVSLVISLPDMRITYTKKKEKPQGDISGASN